MACQSPTRSVMKRSRAVYEESILPSILRQEDRHAESKRPRFRFGTEIDQRIQTIASSVHEVGKRAHVLHNELCSLEAKVDKLDLEREQPHKSFVIERLCNSSFSDSRLCDSGIESGMELSSDSLETSVIVSPKAYGHLRKRQLLDQTLKKSSLRVKEESDILEGLFQDNLAILKYKRAENCLLLMIKLQRKLKNIGIAHSTLRKRLVQIL